MYMSSKNKWTNPQEQLLITWAEKASGYAWLHQKSIGYFKRRNMYIAIPSAFCGYIGGTGTLLLDSDAHTVWRGLIGVIGILSGLLSNFQDLFTFKEEGEKHRIAVLRFLSFFREISCELSVAPTNRNSAMDYITMKRFEFDKILEQAPDIPVCIINKFNKKFKHLAVHKPDAVAGIQTIIPYGKELKVIMYKKKLSLRDKIRLLKYFTAWKAQCNFFSYNNEGMIEITNSNQSDLVTIERNGLRGQLSELERNYVTMYGPLSRQKNMFEYQNIKFKCDPLNLDLEKGDGKNI
jgi:hypothetical protein